MLNIKYIQIGGGILRNYFKPLIFKMITAGGGQCPFVGHGLPPFVCL